MKRVTEKRLKGTNVTSLHAEGKKLAAALARHTGQEEGEACQHLFSRLSILLQKGNAAILLNRIPRYPEGVVDGDQELG